MPLLWRYLLRNFFQVFALSVSAFIAVLLVTRFQSIARFAATGASPLLTLKFVTIQIPHILPLAVPLSCLISSFVLFQRMSHSFELTAIRSAGIGFGSLFFPLFFCGLLISLLNFTIVSEISPRCRNYSKHLAYEMRLMNPLSLLQKEGLFKRANAHVDMKILESGKHAKDVSIVMRNISNQRLGLMVAKELSLEEDKLQGERVTFISSLPAKNPDSFDHLVIENQAEMSTNASQLTKYLIDQNLKLSDHFLSHRMILAKSFVKQGGSAQIPPRALKEMVRRISLSFAPLVFLFVGIASGLDISRNRKYNGALWGAGCAVFYFLALIGGKYMLSNHSLHLSLLLFALPYPFLFFYCFTAIRNISRGIER